MPFHINFTTTVSYTTPNGTVAHPAVSTDLITFNPVMPGYLVPGGEVPQAVDFDAARAALRADLDILFAFALARLQAFPTAP